MFDGKLQAIYVVRRKGEPPQALPSADAVAGSGLAGDRYFQQADSGKPRSPDREVTLIEIEAIEALVRDNQITLEPGHARRNLITRDVPLNHLIGKEFSIGDVLLRGIRLCEPCAHLEGLTQKGIRDGLCHRGGLRAQIVRGGTIRNGDSIRPMTSFSEYDSKNGANDGPGQEAERSGHENA
jgi:MOSC domain-containing protein YiiM